MIQNSSRRSILKEKELWLLVALCLGYFHRPLFLGETFFFRDLYSAFLPQKQLLADFFAAREFPLWNPYLNGGQAYLTSIANAVFDPFNVLYALLPLFDAFNLHIVLLVMLMTVFAYLVSRELGFQPLTSAIAGVLFGFSGYTLSLINVLNLLRAIVYLPLLLYEWQRFFATGKTRWFGAAVLTGALQVCTGAPEITSLSVLFLLGWCLFSSYPRYSTMRKVLIWCVLLVCITGIAAIQLLPSLEIMQYSSRAEGLSFAEFSYWSVFPKQLPALVFPGFLGDFDAPGTSEYWGSALTDGEFPCILSLYIGAITLFLALVGGIYRCKPDKWPLRLRLFLLCLIATSLLLSLGRFLPFFHWLYAHVPLITIFRYPVKFFSIGILPIALLAGYAIEMSFGEHSGVETGTRKVFLSVLWSVGVSLGFLALAFMTSHPLAVRMQGFFFPEADQEILLRGLARGCAHTMVVWLAVTLLYQYRSLYKRRWQHWMLAAILVCDVLAAGRVVNPTASREFLTTVPAAVQHVHEHIGNGRFFRTDLPQNVSLRMPSHELIWKYRWSLEALASYLAAFYRIPFIFHHDLVGLLSPEILKLHGFANTLPWEQRLPLLAAGGVSVFLTEDVVDLPGVRKVADIPTRSNLRSFLYVHEKTAAPVEFVTTWTFAGSETEVFATLFAPGYDPRHEVVLQSPKPSFLFSLLPERFQSLQVQPPDTSLKCDASQVRIIPDTHRTPYSASSFVSSRCPGVLVFSEPCYPGWKISVDGKNVPIWRANYGFSAIFLPEGTHTVKRSYCPDTLIIGAICSIHFLLITAFITYTGFFLRRR